MKPVKYIFFFMLIFTLGKISAAGAVQKSIELNYTDYKKAIKQLDSDLSFIETLLLKNRITALKCSNGILDKEDREFLSRNFFNNILSIAQIRKTSKYNDRVLLDSDYPLWPRKIVLKNRRNEGIFLPVLKPADFGLDTWIIIDSKPVFIIKSDFLDQNTANKMIRVMDQGIEVIIRERRKIQTGLENLKIIEDKNNVN